MYYLYLAVGSLLIALMLQPTFNPKPRLGRLLLTKSYF
jgi:hypothetical protein